MAKKHKFSAILKKQVQELLKDPSTILDIELTERYAADVYHLPNGKLLAVIDNGRGRGLGRMYDSRESFIAMLLDLEKQWAGKPEEGSIVPSRKVKKLLDSSEWSLDIELNEQFHFYTIYKNFDGKVLVIPNIQGLNEGAGILYPSKEQYLDYLKPKHILQGRLPQKQNFINEVSSLVDELAVQLSISKEKLDKSEASIGKVEWAIGRFGKHNCLEPEVFPCLLAYIGEVIRQQSGDQWQMRLATDGETWEPWLVTDKSRSYQFFVELFKQLYEGTLGLRSIVSWETRR